MAKKKRKKSERKRTLKYGNIALTKIKNNEVGAEAGKVSKESKKAFVSRESSGFKRELKRNLTYVGSFLAVLLVIYFLLIKTNILSPILDLIGLKGLYR